MDKKTEFAYLLKELMDTKDGNAFQNVVAENIKSVTPEFLEYLDETVDEAESESDERIRRGAKLLRAVRESIDIALARIKRSRKANQQQGWLGKLTGKPSQEPERFEEKSKIDWETIPVPIPQSLEEFYRLALKKYGYTESIMPMSVFQMGFVNGIRGALIDELTSEEMNKYRKLKTPKEQLEYLDKRLLQPDELWNWGLYYVRQNMRKVNNMAL